MLFHGFPHLCRQQPLSDIYIGLELPSLALEQTEIDLLADEAEPHCDLVLSLTRGGSPVPISRIAVSASDVQVPCPELDQPGQSPPILLDDKPLVIPLMLTEAMHRYLALHPRGAELTLSVFLVDHEAAFHLKFLVRRPTPGRPELAGPGRLQALAGRQARLEVEIINRGGRSFQAGTAVIDIQLADNWQAFPIRANGGGNVTIEPEESRLVTFRVPLALPDGTTLKPGEYLGRLRLECLLPEPVELIDRFSLNIVPEQSFRGSISIDFGTSATAVSYLRDSQHEREPAVLRLGGEHSYLPTAIAYLSEPKTKNIRYFIGEEAQRLAYGTAKDKVRYFDNLKWRLDLSDQIGVGAGNNKSWIAIAADYLRALKTEIEEHPEIVGTIDQVYPTCPARFGAPAMAALMLAFEKAGFTPCRVPEREGRVAILSESWAPIVLALPLPDIADIQDKAIGETKLLGAQPIGRHTILTFDVGGGSTDISLFLIEVANRRSFLVRELATEGDNRFSGNGISALLYRHLRPSLEKSLVARGVAPADVPIHLPWDAFPEGGPSQTALTNGRTVSEMLFELQRNMGGLLGPIMHVEGGLEESSSKAGTLDIDNPDVERLWLDSQNNMTDTYKPLGDAPLTLLTVGNKSIALPWGRDGIFLSLVPLIQNLVKTYLRPMTARLAAMIERAGQPIDNVLLLPTGRGTLCPLVRELYLAALNATLGKNRFTEIRTADRYRKTITSQGACFLAELLVSDPDIRFISDAIPRMGVIGARDPTTGHRQFVPMSEGAILRPEDGPRVIPWPSSPGRFRRVVDVILGACENEAVTGDHRRIARVTAEIELSAEEAKSTHLLVEAIGEGELEIALICPPPAPSGEVDFAGLERKLIGRHTLTVRESNLAP
ncbi:MAG: hypothetical protein WCF85_17885 [Rhodospirillaceae bacterium]